MKENTPSVDYLENESLTLQLIGSSDSAKPEEASLLLSMIDSPTSVWLMKIPGFGKNFEKASKIWS